MLNGQNNNVDIWAITRSTYHCELFRSQLQGIFDIVKDERRKCCSGNHNGNFCGKHVVKVADFLVLRAERSSCADAVSLVKNYPGDVAHKMCIFDKMFKASTQLHELLRGDDNPLIFKVHYGLRLTRDL